jgi:hypothetical protein
MPTDQANQEDLLRRRAYQLWQDDGMREDRTLQYWLEAEKLEAAARARRRAEGDAKRGKE